MQPTSYRLEAPLLAEAEAAARQLGHGFVAPEHLLLAVAARCEGASGALLDRHGLSAEALRREVEAVLGPTVAAPAGEPLTVAQRAVVALGEAVRAGRGATGAPATDAVFAALLSDAVARGAVVGAVLQRAGLPLAAARAEFAAGDPHAPEA